MKYKESAGIALLAITGSSLLVMGVWLGLSQHKALTPAHHALRQQEPSVRLEENLRRLVQLVRDLPSDDEAYGTLWSLACALDDRVFQAERSRHESLMIYELIEIANDPSVPETWESHQELRENLSEMFSSWARFGSRYEQLQRGLRLYEAKLWREATLEWNGVDRLPAPFRMRMGLALAAQGMYDQAECAVISARDAILSPRLKAQADDIVQKIRVLSDATRENIDVKDAL